MRATMALWAVLAAAVLATAAPPVVTVPVEVPGDVSAFVVVRATATEAKAVKFYPLDAGLSVFPSDLLTDKSVTVVVAAKAGRYRVLCYAGNADGASEPAVCTVVIGKPTTPPPPVDPPVDPPPVSGTKKFFLLIRPDGPIDPVGFEPFATLPAWKELTAAGHKMTDLPVSKLGTGFPRPATLPAMIVTTVSADGKSLTYESTSALPKTDAEIRALVK